MSAAGRIVTKGIEHAHPVLPDYPLLPGDLLVRDEDGTYTKEAPGLCVVGFALSAQMLAAHTRPVTFERDHGLGYVVDGGVPEIDGAR